MDFINLILFVIGGFIYIILELLWRGHTHFAMFIVGGMAFLIIGILNEHYIPWEMSFVKQCFLGAIIITILEFISGCILNLWLDLNIWNYSSIPLNLLGQICLPFSILWFFLSGIAIYLDDWIRYLLYLIFGGKKRELPHYKIL